MCLDGDSPTGNPNSHKDIGPLSPRPSHLPVRKTRLGIKITPHGLRHAHASWLLAGGADIQVVKERLGHGSIRTTELYLRSLPGSRDTGLDALMATWGARKSAGTQRPKPEPAPVTTADFVSMLEDIKQTLEAIRAKEGLAAEE
jgi:Phage integrase family